MRKYMIPALLAVSVAATPAAQSKTSNCTNADPTSEVANVSGDFEFNVDPQDPAGNLDTSKNRGRSGRRAAVFAGSASGCLRRLGFARRALSAAARVGQVDAVWPLSQTIRCML